MRINLITFSNGLVSVVPGRDDPKDRDLLVIKPASDEAGDEEEFELAWNGDESISLITKGDARDEGGRSQRFVSCDKEVTRARRFITEEPSDAEKFSIMFFNFGENAYLWSWGAQAFLGYDNIVSLKATSIFPGPFELFHLVWLDSLPPFVRRRASDSVSSGHKI